MNPASIIAGLFRLDQEAMLSDPSQLGIFLELAQTIIELEPRAREAAVTLALQGQEIPGRVLVRHEGNRFVESAHVRKLLLECPVERLSTLLETLAKVLGNISESRWKTLCDVVGRLDGEGVISQAGATAFLRRVA
jgi:hypothetical protein